jgi:TRAP-type C4-dicarboxylate transport system permease small subunit
MTSGIGEAAARRPLFLRVRQALAQVDRVSFLLVVVAMALMTSLVAGQVFFRYVLSNSIDWAEEMARLMFVWVMFLAIPHGLKTGIHVGIDVVVCRLSRGTQDTIFRITAALGAVLMAIVFYYAGQVASDTWDELMPTVDVTSAVYYLAVLVAAGHSFLHLVLLTWGGPTTWNEGEP